MQYRNKEYLIEQYKTKTVPQIAFENGVSKGIVFKFMRRHGIVMNKRRQAKTKVTIKCSYCFKPFERFAGILSQQNFCGYECYHKWMVGNTAGEKCPNWKGGITRISSNGLKTLEWNNTKKECLKRFPLCVLCGDTNHLQGHHIKKREDHPELIYKVDNVITLCRSCHASIKGKEADWEEFFMRLVSKGGELLEHPNGNAEGNQQPSQSKMVKLVDWKVQRLTGEDTIPNTPDTSAAPERDDIVRAYAKA